MNTYISPNLDKNTQGDFLILSEAKDLKCFYKINFRFFSRELFFFFVGVI